MESEAAVASLSALAHAGRLSVIRLLVQAGPDGLPAGEISRRLGIAPNTLSASLGQLANAGLVVSERAGRSIIYRASFARMTALVEFLMSDCCAGNPQLCAPGVLGE